MEKAKYNDFWHTQMSECTTSCQEEHSFTDKVGSCFVCVGNFISTTFKAIFKV